MSNERERALVRRVCRQYGATGSEPSDVEIDALIGDFDRFDAPPAASVEARERALVRTSVVAGRMYEGTRDGSQYAMTKDVIADFEAEVGDEACDAIIANINRSHPRAPDAAALEAEIEAVLARMPAECVVRVCEGGGPENLAASLAVSVAGLTRALGDAYEQAAKVCDAEREVQRKNARDLSGTEHTLKYAYCAAMLDAIATTIRALAPSARDAKASGEASASVLLALTGCDLSGYACSACAARGVRLYRQYQTCAVAIDLLCRACALADQKRDSPDAASEHTIGWLVAAVPSPGGTFWGFTSVPDEGVAWWNALPKECS